jgi:hypothetical protein
MCFNFVIFFFLMRLHQRRLVAPRELESQTARHLNLNEFHRATCEVRHQALYLFDFLAFLAGLPS